MNSEHPSPEQESDEFYVVGLESIPSMEIAPIAGMKRWLAKRRQRRDDLRVSDRPNRYYDGPAAAALLPVEFLEPFPEQHGANARDRDRFYAGPDTDGSDYQPRSLGIFAGEGAAPALDFARQLEAGADPIDD